MDGTISGEASHARHAPIQDAMNNPKLLHIQ